MEQYKKGERFVRAIAEARGPAALDAAVGRARRRCRATARSRSPTRWIARVLDAAPRADDGMTGRREPDAPARDAARAARRPPSR